VNLIDGLDGLAAGVVFFAATTNFVVAWLNGAVLVAVLSGAVAGSVLGFLFYNFNPARIFMGDSGSYFLGFILAACSIAGPLQKASATISIVVPLVALGVPIIDTLLAIVRRFLERRPLFSPDRGHIHHRLLDMGITHRRAVLIIYGVSIALCVGAIGIAFGRSWEVGAAILGVSAVLFGLIRFIGYFEYLMVIGRQKQRIRSRHVEWLRKVVLQLGPRLGSTSTDDAALEELKWLAENARFDFIELLGPHDAVFKSWAGADYTDMDRRDMCTARFPIAGNGYTLKFGWRSEYGDVPPQMDILLQLVVDQVQSALEVHQSAITRQPAVPAPDSVTQTAPARAH
jgi:UDP-GlcNAc:undecaprenyl-phosphate GlcNAc-1-phosphate transferase